MVTAYDCFLARGSSVLLYFLQVLSAWPTSAQWQHYVYLFGVPKQWPTAACSCAVLWCTQGATNALRRLTVDLLERY